MVPPVGLVFGALVISKAVADDEHRYAELPLFDHEGAGGGQGGAGSVFSERACSCAGAARPAERVGEVD
jgi:hypothetical protein